MINIETIYLIDVFLISLCIGSFLNVVIYRTPIIKPGFNLNTPSSHCPKCKHKLSWYENLPVVAWIILLGKCKSCKAPISIQYPILETLTGLIITLPVIVYGLRPFSIVAGLTIAFAIPSIWWLTKKIKFNNYMYYWSTLTILSFITTVILYATNH